MVIGSWRVALAAALFALPFWAASATPAHACTCAILSMDEHVNNADAIVVGVVGEPLLVDPVPTPQPPSPGSGARVVSFHARVQWPVDVEEYIKGAGPTELAGQSTASVEQYGDGETSISTGLSESCGYAPEPDERHLLLLKQEEADLFSTEGCAGNIAIVPDIEAFAAERIAEIRAIVAGAATQTAEARPTVVLPDAGGGDTAADDITSMWSYAMAAGAGAALAGGALLLFRRR